MGHVSGSWAESIDSVNALVSDLVHPTRETARVIGAVAEGRPFAIDGAGNRRPTARRRIPAHRQDRQSMVDQLGSFASEVTRVAREVGTEGKLGGQAKVKGVAGTWKDLTDNVNLMAGNLTGQVRNIADRDHGRGQRRLDQEDHRRREGRIPRAEKHDQYDGRSASLVRLGSDARGPRGRHRRQARRTSQGGRGLRHVERPHRQRELDGRQSHRPSAQHRRRDHGRRQRRPCRRRSPST